eukprot:1144336-Pelagomonas_calceolata.AAC.1
MGTSCSHSIPCNAWEPMTVDVFAINWHFQSPVVGILRYQTLSPLHQPPAVTFHHTALTACVTPRRDDACACCFRSAARRRPGGALASSGPEVA